MCGIAGITGPEAGEHIAAVSRMKSALAHRGPDGEGIYVAPSGSCVLAHTRLAILDLSSAAAQPMLSADGRFALTYNGEAYNYGGLRQELKEDGSWRSSGDTEVVLRLLACRGASGLQRLNGMFALALWDEGEQRLLLARDRFGQKPLYWARVGSCVAFASEARALIASGLTSGRLEVAGILSFLSFGAVQGSGTVFSRVASLPPGCELQITGRGVGAPQPYWEPGRGKTVAHAEELRDTWVAAVGRHLISDARIGVFLSGGIDSSAVAAAAARAPTGTIKTLSVVFPDEPTMSEARHARRVAEAVGSDHSEVPLSAAEMLQMLPRALQALDQPAGDSFNTYVISRAARSAGWKAALSGIGGDELFGGYPSFGDVPKLARTRRMLRAVRGLSHDLLGRWTPDGKRAAKVVDLFDAPEGLLPAYLVRRRVFSSRQVRALAPGIAGSGWLSGVPEPTLKDLRGVLKRRAVPDAIALMEAALYMAPVLLRDSDVMGMAHGLEIRLPFLDAEFSSLAFTLTPEVRRSGPRAKWAFLQAVRDWLPAENLSRPKQGFALPFRDWMLRRLRDEIEDGIEALAQLSPLVDVRAARQVWRVFQASPHRIDWYRPWCLFVLGRYCLERNIRC